MKATMFRACGLAALAVVLVVVGTAQAQQAPQTDKELFRLD